MKQLSLLLAILLLGSSLRAADIVAFCIGNNAYTRAEDQLDTPINDATLMRDTLVALGADVILLTDATREQMEIGLNTFKAKATGARLALFYYSGHGTEDTPDGFNKPETFLLPVDAHIPDVNYLPARALGLGKVLEKMQQTPVTARAVILDCCRNSAPRALGTLAARTKSFGDLDERVKQALGAAIVPDATLIAFAASPGRKAAAFLTESDTNSPFTHFLAEQLRSGTGNLRDLVETAAETTETRTGRRQVPYVTYTGAASAIRQITFGRSTPPAVMARLSPEIPLAPPAPAPVSSGPGSATKGGPFVNSLGQKFVPAVTYKDGTKVLFSIWETRRQDYEAYAKASSGVDDTWKAVESEGQPVGHEPTHPVVSVSWDDATAFCKWLTQRERAAGRIGPKDEYRLPSDLEWSYAVGIGPKEDASASPKDKDKKIADAYPWGAGYPPVLNSGNYADETAKFKGAIHVQIDSYRDGYATTAPVGAYEANGLGIYDLGGNVWEWCVDWYDGEQKYRVMRGGSWVSNVSSFLLSSFRSNDEPGYRYHFYGFRCVLVVSGG